MSNLRLLNETTVSSGVSSVDVTNVFSFDFDIYQIDISDMTSNANSYWYLRLINSSGSVLTTDYDNATLLIRSNDAFVEYKGTDKVSLWSNLNICYTDGNSGVFYIFNPFSSSNYTFMLGQETGYGYSSSRTNKNIGVYPNTTSCSGISIANYSSTFTGGTIRTYGLRVDT
tara:strand:+ start:235 stop:747 length:513 start_codon:yes stop_codon:yes gene_type:complete